MLETEHTKTRKDEDVEEEEQSAKNVWGGKNGVRTSLILDGPECQEINEDNGANRQKSLTADRS